MALPFPPRNCLWLIAIESILRRGVGNLTSIWSNPMVRQGKTTYHINWYDRFWRDLVGANKSWCRFNGASGMAISATLLSVQSAADHPQRRRGSWAFERAILRHQRKGMAIAMDNKTTVIPMVGGARFDALPPLKEEANTSRWCTTQHGAWTPTSAPSERHTRRFRTYLGAH